MNASIGKLLLLLSAAAVCAVGISSMFAQDINQNVPSDHQSVNVRTYGARGDGITDNKNAIDAAIAATSDGGVVSLDPGIYLITSTIEPTRRIKLKCQAAIGVHSMIGPCTIKKAANMKGPAIFLHGNGVRGSSIEGLTIDGDKGNVGPGLILIYPWATLRDVRVEHQGGDGIVVGSDTSSDSEDANFSRFDNVISRFNKGRGFYVSQSTTKGENNANAGTWTNVTAENNDSDGFALAAATNNTIVGIDSEANKGVGLHFLAPAARNQIIGGDLNEGNVQGNLQFDSGTLGNVVQADVKNIPPYYADHSIGKFGSTNRVISSMVQDFGQIGISGSGYSQAGFGIGPTGGTGAALEVHGAFAGPLFGVVRISSDAGVPTMILRKARGTEQYPATVQSGDGIGRYYFGAYNGSRWISSAFFGSIIDGSVADGAVPGALVFDTCLLASNCIERVRISSTGEVGIGKTAERGVALDVKGEAAFSGGITTGNPGVAGHVVCWKDTTHIGYCSSQPDSGGSCYCN